MILQIIQDALPVLNIHKGNGKAQALNLNGNIIAYITANNNTCISRK